MSSNRTYRVGSYSLITKPRLGSGSYGSVYKAHHVKTNHTVAVKAITRGKLNQKELENVSSEIAIMKALKHPNVVELYDIEKSDKYIFLVMEYCGGGDLSQFLRKVKRLKESQATRFLQQLATGLEFMRMNNLVHRDLKPQNLLLTESSVNAVIKVADFGFARFLGEEDLAKSVCGSPLYMAPEILRAQPYDAKADLWSVGAILFEMLVGAPPFTARNRFELLANIEKQRVEIPAELGLSVEVSHLIKDCLLKHNPVERMSFEEFFLHPVLDFASLLPDVAAKPPSALDSIVIKTVAVIPPTPPSQDNAMGSTDMLPRVTMLDVPFPFAEGYSDGEEASSIPTGLGSTALRVLPSPPDRPFPSGASPPLPVSISPPLTGLLMAPSSDSFSRGRSNRLHHDMTANPPVVISRLAFPSTAPVTAPAREGKLLRSADSSKNEGPPPQDSAEYVMIDREHVELNVYADRVGQQYGSNVTDVLPGGKRSVAIQIAQGSPEHGSGGESVGSPLRSMSPLQASPPFPLAASPEMLTDYLMPHSIQFGAVLTLTSSGTDSVSAWYERATGEILSSQPQTVVLEQLDRIGKQASVVAELSILYAHKNLYPTSLALCIEALHLSRDGLHLAKQSLNELEGSRSINLVVQLLREQFNDCLSWAERVRLQASRSRDYDKIKVCAETLFYEHAVKVAQEAGVDELRGNYANSEVKYQKGLLLLETISGRGTLVEEDVAVLDNLMANVIERIRSVRSRVHDQTQSVSSSPPPHLTPAVARDED